MKLAGNGTKNLIFLIFLIFIFLSSAGSVCASAADQLVLTEQPALLQLRVVFPTRVSFLNSGHHFFLFDSEVKQTQIPDSVWTN